MKDTKIQFLCTKNSIDKETMIDRKNFFARFDELAKVYDPFDNSIQKKLVEIIPIIDRIEIYEDFNNTQDIPMILYVIDSEEKILKIPRYYKAVWDILRSYCK